MSESGDQPRIEELEAARQVIGDVLKDANANLIFGSPVDTSALPDYLDVVKNPKDLGTILSDLEYSINGDGPYNSAEDVLKDIDQVWRNCLLYNNQPEDKSIVDICKKTAKFLSREWKKAGLAGESKASALPSERGGGDGGASESAAKDKDVEILPMHLLTNFEVMSSIANGELRALDTLLDLRNSAGGTLFLSGDVVAPAAPDAQTQEPGPVAGHISDAILDWVAEYGSSEVCIWVVTASAWYKLLKPTERYASLLEPIQQRIALANSAIEEIQPEDVNEIGSLIDRVANGEVQPEAKDFATCQVESKIGKRRPRNAGGKKRRAGGTPGGSSLKRPRGMLKSTSKSRLGAGAVGDIVEAGFFLGDEIDAVSDTDMPEDFSLSDGEEPEVPEGEDAAEVLEKARRRAWKKIKYWQRKTEAAEKQRILEEAETAREAKEDAERGTPPEPTQDFRLPEHCIPDLLMFWEFTQAFGDVLQLPPYSLAALEAALAPGPRVKRGEPILESSSSEEEDEDDEEDEEEEEGKEEDNGGGEEEQEQEVAGDEKNDKEGEEGDVKDEVEKEQQSPIEVENEDDGSPSKPATGGLRGRRKPAPPPPKQPWQRKGPKSAPQNIIEDPIVKTRRQRGVPTPGAAPKLADEQAALDLESKKKKKKKSKFSQKQQPTGDADPNAPPENAIAAAIQAAQRAQEAFVKMLKTKYGVKNAEEVVSMAPIDRNFSSSGVLLRDIVCALVRATHNALSAEALATATVGGGEQPRVGKLVNNENENPVWPERAANTVWAAASSSPEDRHIALRLAYGDYLDLTPEERLQLLVALMHAALNSDQMLNIISAKIDVMTATTTRRDGGPGDEQEDEDGRLAAAATMAVVVAPPVIPPPQPVPRVTPPPASAAENGAAAGASAPTAAAAPPGLPPPSPPPNTLELWRRWHQAQNLGLRRRLGSDARGRRYWAIGRQAGAFAIFCEEPENGRWGWYEGEGILQLVAWLSKASIRCEGPLVAALRAAPLPLSSPTPSAPARHLVGMELAIQRADGYRGIAYPLLRGEWSCRKEGGSPLSPEKRVPAAVETLLGAIPFWFKEEGWQKQILAIVEVLSSANIGRDAARALLEAERLLSLDGRMSEEWVDVWQNSWRRLVAGLIDVRDVALYTAALQEHVRVTPDILTRPAFLKIADDVSCMLNIPETGDDVVILRTGLLRHIDRYMQLLGAQPMPQLADGPPVAAAAAPGAVKSEKDAQATTAEEGTGRGDDGDGETAPMTGVTTSKADEDGVSVGGTTAAAEDEGGEGNGPSSASNPNNNNNTNDPNSGVPYLLSPRVSPNAADRIKSDWDQLRAKVEALNPVERYTVHSIVYRRHLADIADLETDEASNAAPRCPVAWICLRPARFGLKHQLPTKDIILPIGIDPYLPNYLIPAGEFVLRTRVLWQPGDRFRMYVGAKKRSKSGGTWYRGKVAGVDPPVPPASAPLPDKEVYDPWESVIVEWDTSAAGETEPISPWVIEIDPEEEMRRVEEAKKQMNTAKRSERARASVRLEPDDPLYAAQQAEWAAEDAKIADTLKMGERAEQLLRTDRDKNEREDGQVFNEAVYGIEAQQAQQILLATVGAPMLAHATAAAAAAAATAAAVAKAAAAQQQPARAAAVAAAAAINTATGGSNNPANIIPSGPLKPGQEVSEEILDALRALTPEQFVTMITNFYRGLKGKFKIPTFAHQELDLFSVWWEVMNRGGYETVTTSKSWKEICRALPLDLSGQTSASYNMRLNYERCLLDFENYLACGQYELDLSANRAPVHTHLTDPSVTRFTIPGAYESTTAAPAPNTLSAEAATVEKQRAKGSKKYGMQLKRLRGKAVGQLVQRYWPEEGGWWNAVITDFNPETGEHQMTYNKGQPEESFEWGDLSELLDSEFRDAMVAGSLPVLGKSSSGGGEGSGAPSHDNHDNQEGSPANDGEDNTAAAPGDDNDVNMEAVVEADEAAAVKKEEEEDDEAVKMEIEDNAAA